MQSGVQLIHILHSRRAKLLSSMPWGSIASQAVHSASLPSAGRLHHSSCLHPPQQLPQQRPSLPSPCWPSCLSCFGPGACSQRKVQTAQILGQVPQFVNWEVHLGALQPPRGWQECCLNLLTYWAKVRS